MILNEKLASVCISFGYEEKAIATNMEVLRWKKGRGSSILENLFTLGKMYSRSSVMMENVAEATSQLKKP